MLKGLCKELKVDSLVKVIIGMYVVVALNISLFYGWSRNYSGSYIVPLNQMKDVIGKGVSIMTSLLYVIVVENSILLVCGVILGVIIYNLINQLIMVMQVEETII